MGFGGLGRANSKSKSGDYNLVRCWNFFGVPSVGFTRYRSLPCTDTRLALNYYQHMDPVHHDVIVYSDSMSCLQAIEGEDTENPFICHIMNLLWSLSDKGTRVCFCLVPSHCGIDGNERVDQLAKETLDQDIDPLASVHYTDMKPLVNSYIQKLVQTNWPCDNCTKLLPHWGRVTHICVSRLTTIGSDNYLNQCWNIVNWTLGNKLQWNLNRNSYIFIQENAFKNVVWEMAAILSWPLKYSSRNTSCHMKPHSEIWSGAEVKFQDTELKLIHIQEHWPLDHQLLHECIPKVGHHYFWCQANTWPNADIMIFKIY